MYRLLPIFLFAGLSWTGQSQPVSLLVISEGVHLREGPTSNSASLAVLPFGTRVFCQRDSMTYAFGRDLVPEHPDELRLAGTEASVMAGMVAKGGVLPRDTGYLQGLWWPVEYGGRHGYLFSAFLYDGSLAPGAADSIELISEVGDRKLFWRPDWHWYGLYDEKGEARLRAIQPYWMVDWDEDEGGAPRLVTGQRERALFIIAAKNPLPLDHYRGEWPTRDGGFEPVIDLRAHKRTPNAALLRTSQLAVEWTPESQSGTTDLITKVWACGAKNTRQQLFPIQYSGEWTAENLYIGWYGDLDGDGQRDYILGAPDFEAHYTQFWLFLSSRAEKGDLLKLVSQAGIFDGA